MYKYVKFTIIVWGKKNNIKDIHLLFIFLCCSISNYVIIVDLERAGSTRRLPSTVQIIKLWVDLGLKVGFCTGVAVQGLFCVTNNICKKLQLHKLQRTWATWIVSICQKKIIEQTNWRKHSLIDNDILANVHNTWISCRVQKGNLIQHS